MVAARRCNNPRGLRPIALDSVKIDDAATHLESADWRVVLMLDDNFHAGQVFKQRPSILWGWWDARANQRDYVLKLSECKHRTIEAHNDVLWLHHNVQSPKAAAGQHRSLFSELFPMVSLATPLFAR